VKWTRYKTTLIKFTVDSEHDRKRRGVSAVLRGMAVTRGGELLSLHCCFSRFQSNMRAVRGSRGKIKREIRDGIAEWRCGYRSLCGDAVTIGAARPQRGFSCSWRTARVYRGSGGKLKTRETRHGARARWVIHPHLESLKIQIEGKEMKGKLLFIAALKRRDSPDSSVRVHALCLSRGRRLITLLSALTIRVTRQ